MFGIAGGVGGFMPAVNPLHLSDGAALPRITSSGSVAEIEVSSAGLKSKTVSAGTGNLHEQARIGRGGGGPITTPHGSSARGAITTFLTSTAPDRQTTPSPPGGRYSGRVCGRAAGGGTGPCGPLRTRSRIAALPSGRS